MLNFYALGDSGQDTPLRRQNLLMMHYQKEKEPVDAVFLLGDNFYDYGVKSVHDPQWEEFERTYRPWCPFYAILGNHDYLGNPQAQVQYSQNPNTHWKMPSRYYDKKFLFPGQADGVHAFFLDTFTLSPRESRMCSLAMGMVDYDLLFPHKDEGQLQWLDRKLAESTMTWKVVLGHYPIFSHGLHGDTPELVRDLYPLLQKHGVDFYLSGHDHSLELMRRDDLNLIVSGTGCSSNPVAYSHQSIYTSDTTTFGFSVLQFTAQSARFGFTTNHGPTMWHCLPKHKNVSYSFL
jgi:acid phosphatase